MANWDTAKELDWILTAEDSALESNQALHEDQKTAEHVRLPKQLHDAQHHSLGHTISSARQFQDASTEQTTKKVPHDPSFAFEYDNQRIPQLPSSFWNNPVLDTSNVTCGTPPINGDGTPADVSQRQQNSPLEVFLCNRGECGGRYFHRKCEWTKHMNAHERVFRCLVGGCSSSFTRDSDLRRHDESVHQKIVHFWCTIPECAARQVSFARKDHFMQHLSKHASPVGTVPGPATEKAKAGPTRKRRRGSSFDESGARDDNKGEMLRLRAENERLQDTVKKLTETLHALILKKN